KADGDMSSGEESDGQGAAREVEAREASRSTKRGPKNQTLKHWYEPVPIITPEKGARWEFRCKYCTVTRTVPRTVRGDKPDFADESPQPYVGNLATHITKAHPNVPLQERNSASTSHAVPNEGDGAPEPKAYVKNGALNPALTANQKGFNRIFAAWIFEDDLPFTTGDDTTVRNALAKIFIDLHATVVQELTAINRWVLDGDETTQLLFLTVQEWELLAKIGALLQVFTKVTKEMSRSCTPTLPYVLPMYEHMFKSLDMYARDEKISPDIRNAAAAGLRKLNEYYSLAKASQVTLLATSMSSHHAVCWC
ncbi:hypothetical protein LXA43DRAFT_896683, partial [Ganoderma leucocontextum]